MRLVSFCILGGLSGAVANVTATSLAPRSPAVTVSPIPYSDKSQEDQLTAIKDLQLKRILKNMVAKESLLKLKCLQADNAQILTAEGLEKICENLKHLSLSGNSISNIAALAQLKELITLNLSKNLIVVPAGIGSLKQLESLDLSHNQLKYAFCCSFVSLRYLRLNDNNIQQLIFIKDFNKLLEEVDISNNTLKNIAIKAPLLSLKKLSANGTFLTQVDDLKHLQNLEVLELKNCPYLHSIASLFYRIGEHWQCKLQKLKVLRISEEFLDKESKDILADIKGKKNSMLTVQ